MQRILTEEEYQELLKSQQPSSFGSKDVVSAFPILTSNGLDGKPANAVRLQISKNGYFFLAYFEKEVIEMMYSIINK